MLVPDTTQVIVEVVICGAAATGRILSVGQSAFVVGVHHCPGPVIVRYKRSGLYACSTDRHHKVADVFPNLYEVLERL